VNTRLLLPDGLEGIGRFSVEVLRRMVLANPEVNFHFFFDRKFDEKYLFGPNITPHVLFPPARHAALFVLFFEYAVAARLKKVNADVFFSPDGYLSLRSQVPQVPVFHDLAFEHFPEDVAKSAAWHYRRYFPRYAAKAQHILAVSEYTKQDIVRQYGTDPSKITVAYNACSGIFHPIESQAQAQIREKLTGGKPYFHCVGAIQPRKNLARLIEAFGQFKAQTGSDWKLVVVGRKAWNFEEVIHTYAASKVKDEIVFTGFVPDAELNAIYSASEGLCYVPYFEGFGIPILEAMHAQTPVICSNLTSMPEVAGDAALLVDPYQTPAIAEAMTTLYQSPALAKDLVQKGIHRSLQFNWDQTAERVWQVLTKA
jgi:glycosyltransferase involved in cell wall biosynthesis